MRIHLFSLALAAIILLAWYELNALAVGNFPATITALVSSSDALTAFAVLVVASFSTGLIVHFLYERRQRVSK